MAGKVGPARAKFRTQEARIATFNKGHKIAASSGRGKQTVKWPLDAPDCESLALSGFYYEPLADALDRTTCYACGYSLDGWEESDDPTHEHYELAKTCCLALVQYRAWLYMSDDEMDPEFTESEFNPHCEKMVLARQRTFAMNNWPHDKKKGWFSTSERLARAGFYCNLEDKESDLATCAYCELSLDGWEPKDDPVEEHRRRSPDCIFFTTPEPQKKTRSKKRSHAEEGHGLPNKRRSTSKSTRLSAFDQKSALSDDDDDLFKNAPDMKEVEPVGVRSTKSTRRSTKPIIPAINSAEGKKNTRTRRSKIPKPEPEPASDSYSDDIDDDDDDENNEEPDSDNDPEEPNGDDDNAGSNAPNEPREDGSEAKDSNDANDSRRSNGSNKENEDVSLRSDKFFDANEFSNSTSVPASRRVSEFDVDYSSESDLDSAPELETDFEISPVKPRVPGALPSLKGRILFPLEQAGEDLQVEKVDPKPRKQSKKPQEKSAETRKSKRSQEKETKPSKKSQERPIETKPTKKSEKRKQSKKQSEPEKHNAIDGLEEVANEPAKPAKHAKPEEVDHPEVVDEPEVVEEPEVVDEPEVVEEPELANEPEAVDEPEEAEEAKVVEEADVVEEPEAEAIDEQVVEKVADEPEIVDDSVTKCNDSPRNDSSLDGTTAVEPGDKVVAQNPDDSPGGPAKPPMVEIPPTPKAEKTSFVTQSGKAIDWNMSDPDEAFDVLESLNMTIDDASVLDLTVAQYIKHISYLSTQQLEAKSQRLIGMIKQQGERALQVLQDLETED